MEVLDAFLQSFSSFNTEKIRYKYYNKRITIRGNGNAQPHGQGEAKLTVPKTRAVVLIYLQMIK